MLGQTLGEKITDPDQEAEEKENDGPESETVRESAPAAQPVG